MNLLKKKKTLNYILLSLVLLVFLAGLFLVLYYFQDQKQECTSNPLVYGANQLKEKIGYEFVGMGYFEVPLQIKSPTIIFNSTSMSIKE